jgi:hypothetical protein
MNLHEHAGKIEKAALTVSGPFSCAEDNTDFFGRPSPRVRRLLETWEARHPHRNIRLLLLESLERHRYIDVK